MDQRVNKPNNQFMNYWMVKTEPSSYSWEDLLSKKEEIWDGVRNYQARNFLKEMKLGDPVLVYHSGKDRAVVGLAEVSEEAFPDPKDADWVAVRLKAKSSLPKSVSLQAIKEEDRLSEMLMLRQSRLSVMSVTQAEFELLMRLSK
ncbi:putative RNA-binding protein with PUA-like domain [Algoriphagus aquaeductus]|uniref:Putative RNA-binding protein with PUA-like domain n=2 Tax=Cyclobacteriaceae TaxID=563798 RepID=A0A326RWZ7_9BACT|nr:putative RNA-binding protein with PUA-like domain [Algoriphagus aquaeductus]